MDSVSEIKARLPIDELVRQYVQLTKKGRNFVGLCPFHQDSRPSFLVSPDKGICYCFPCQKGGDIFSFYQLIEGVDFPQAIKDLAEKTGVVLPEHEKGAIKKDEKDRLRDCLTAAASFYTLQLKSSDATKKYLADRGVSDQEATDFGLGIAPDSFNATYDHLLKVGFSRKEITLAGLGVQKDMRDERIYDRFRNRLMFPIHDSQSRVIGFGGRTLGNDDAKYINTSDSPLYHKSQVLYALDRAQKPMREKNRVVLVEGYFDVLACHRVGVTEAVATCGTALTDEHAKILKRTVDRVVLCLDQDTAGKAAAERAFIVCAKEGLQVEGIVLSDKDPADAAVTSSDQLKMMLEKGARPYLDIVLDAVRASDIRTPSGRHIALERLMPLLHAVSSATEREQMIRSTALTLGSTETALIDDLRSFEKNAHASKTIVAASSSAADFFSSAELALGLFLLYPRNVTLLTELIAPEGGFALELYTAMKTNAEATAPLTIDALALSDDGRKRASILVLYCEENGFTEWNDAVAIREIRRNCKLSNREQIKKKQLEVTGKLIAARSSGDKTEEQLLMTQYLELLKLSKMAA